jgi:hypothetical protein
LNPNAPSVDFPVGRFFMGVWFVIGLSVTTFAAFTLAILWGDFEGWRYMLLLSAWGVASVGAISALWQGQPKCWLSWSGNEWQVLSLLTAESRTPSMADCAMTVHLDLQKYLIVSVFNRAGFRQWFWVAQNSFPDRWHGFRCAVYSRSESDIVH